MAERKRRRDDCPRKDCEGFLTPIDFYFEYVYENKKTIAKKVWYQTCPWCGIKVPISKVEQDKLRHKYVVKTRENNSRTPKPAYQYEDLIYS